MNNNYSDVAVERQPSEMDLVVKSINNQLSNLEDTFGLLEAKVHNLDDTCSRINGAAYPKNSPQKTEPNEKGQPVSPGRDGLMGDFDRIQTRLDYLNKRLGNEFTASLQIAIDHLQKHI